MIRQNKGKRLVKVEVAKGVWVKVEAQSLSHSLRSGTSKLKTESEKTEDRRPMTEMEKIIDVPKLTDDRGRETEVSEPVEPADFTEIVGVGKATYQALHENGIHTFEDLLDADVSFLSKQGQKAVERWRAGL